MIPRLQTEQELESYYSDAATEEELRRIIGEQAPAPAPAAPAPATGRVAVLPAAPAAAPVPQIAPVAVAPFTAHAAPTFAANPADW